MTKPSIERSEWRQACCHILLCMFITHGVPCTAAERFDDVWIEPASANEKGIRFSPRNVIHRKVRVASFDDKTMTFLDSNQTAADDSESGSLQVASARVIWVEPGFDDADTIAAIQTFRGGNFKESIAPLLDAINRRPTVWRAQWLSMHLWQAAYQAQRYPASLELINQIDARPLPAMLVGGLPIHWTSERMPPEAIAAANQVVASEASLEATKLVAASWLLGQPGDSQAYAVLEAMARQNARPSLAQLASVLLWRKAPPPTFRENRQQWQATLRTLPMTMNPGPTLLLADRLQASGDKETSLELFLSVAVTPSRPHSIVNVAKVRAAEILIQLGQPDAAKRVADVKP